MKSSGASGVRPIRRAGRSGGKSIFERTDADLEAANTLVLFSKKPIHFNRRASADNQSVPKCIDGLPSSVTGQPSRKRVRFEVETSPSAEHVATPTLTKAWSGETAQCLPNKLDNRSWDEKFEKDRASAGEVVRSCAEPLGTLFKASADIKVKRRMATFEEGYAFAQAVVKSLQQSLFRASRYDGAVDSNLLTLQKRATQATESRRRASHSNTTVSSALIANANTNTNTHTPRDAHNRNMDGIWEDHAYGFMPVPEFEPQGFDSMDTVFPQGKFLDQADINKALFAALKKMHSEVLKTSASNQSLYDYVGTLKARIMALEQDNTQLRAMLDGRGIKQPPPKLSLAISKLDLDEHPSGGLPTPSTAALSGTTLAFPSRPYTGSGLAFQQNGGISSSAASSFAEGAASSFDAAMTVPPTPTTPGNRTVLYKKEKHDLTGKLPPANVKLPLVPLTDVELIVFFYNSTSRPIVSVRLYARGGPNVIAQIINDHRIVRPDGYKRNTCSVHCNKAVKTFIGTCGEDSKKQMSDFFETAGDEEATDAIRHQKDEMNKTCDYAVLHLFQDLIKLPAAGYGGIFTECIRWCRDNQVDARLSQVHLIAEALIEGTDPREKLVVPTEKEEIDGYATESATDDDDFSRSSDIVMKDKAPIIELSPTTDGDDSTNISSQSETEDAAPEAPQVSVQEHNIKLEDDTLV